MSIVGSNIRRLRSEQGLTQAQLAEASGITVPQLSLIENGHEPKVHRAEAIAKSLGVSVDELLSEPVGAQS